MKRRCVFCGITEYVFRANQTGVKDGSLDDGWACIDHYHFLIRPRLPSDPPRLYEYEEVA